MDQQQNGQRQKGPQQNGLRQSGRAIKSCTLVRITYRIVQVKRTATLYSTDCIKSI